MAKTFEPRIIQLDALHDLRHHEHEVLERISRTPFGALLFLSDPLRFLSEHGFVVGTRLRESLDRHREQLRKASPGSYDAIKAGHAEACQWTIGIRSLALPAEVGHD